MCLVPNSPSSEASSVIISLRILLCRQVARSQSRILILKFNPTQPDNFDFN